MKKHVAVRFAGLLAVFCALVGMVIPVAGCASPTATPSPAPQPVRLINPLGPLVIPVAGIAEKQVGADVAIEVSYWKTVDEALGLLAGNDVPFAVLPITNGANMKASGIDITLLAVHEWKVFYLLAAKDVQFEGWQSLRGQTVFTPEGKGQTADVLTRFALTRVGLVPDEDVSFAYLPPQEIVALFDSGKASFAAMPEPFVTQVMATGEAKIALDYQEYWSQVSGSTHGIPVAGLFVKSDFLGQHPETVNAVAASLAESTRWAENNPDAAVAAGAKVLPQKPEVIKAALDRIGFEFVPAAEAREEVLNFLRTMQETYPEGIKAIPDEGFFAQ